MAIQKTNTPGIQSYSKSDGVITAYYIQWRDINGNNIKKKINTTDILKAEEALQECKMAVKVAKRDIANGLDSVRKSLEHKTLTLDQMAELFYKDRTTSNNTQDRRRYEMYISPTLGEKMVANITKKNVNSLQKFLETNTFIEERTRRDPKTKKKLPPKEYTLAPKTVNSIIDHLRAIFNEGMDDDNLWCERNPVDRKKKVKRLVVDKEPGRVMSDEELELMFTTFKHGDYERGLDKHTTLHLFTKLLYHSGARPAAVLPLKVSDFNFRDNTNTVKIKSLKGGEGYKAKLKPETVQIIKEWIAEHNLKRDECLFYPQQSVHRGTGSKRDHIQYSGLSRASRRYFNPLFNTDDFGIIEDKLERVMLYSLRRTSATKVYKKYGIVEAKKFLRHTDVKTTMHYLNINDDDMEEVIDAL